MQPTKSSQTSGHGKRRVWRRPTVSRLAIGTQTRTPGAARAGAEPPAPAAPASKFGFSFEMSFPLSARAGE